MSDKARDTLESILNQREYQVYYEQSKGLIQTLIERAQAWIVEQLSKLFPSIGQSSGVSGFILVVIVIVVIVILGIVFYKVGGKLNRSRKFREKPLQDIVEKNWSYERHLTEVKKQENLEDHTKACRHLFLALLLYFHEMKWLEAKIWKTNWEYYEELREVDRDGASFFYDFVLLFDQITYGKRLVEKNEYLHYRNEAMKWLDVKEQNFDRG